jgi:hypothetical protein
MDAVANWRRSGRRLLGVEQATAGFAVGQQEEFTRRGDADREGEGTSAQWGQGAGERGLCAPLYSSSVYVFVRALCICPSLLLVAQRLLRRCPEPRERDSYAAANFGVSRTRKRTWLRAHARYTE